LMDAAMELAEKVAAQPPMALRAAKMLLRKAQNANYATIMEMSAAQQALQHHTEDHIEGVTALLEKRDPNFTGN
ncbi:MAG: enoyl-CoA hydratase, partial [Ponticaulis sp.]|nr:enoyl-CoA hydratase [Ponticaulis sp.]